MKERYLKYFEKFVTPIITVFIVLSIFFSGPIFAIVGIVLALLLCLSCYLLRMWRYFAISVLLFFAVIALIWLHRL